MTLAERIQWLQAALDKAPETKLGFQVRSILSAYRDNRRLVQEAYSELGAVVPQLSINDDHIVVERVKKAHTLLEVALKGER